MPELPEVETIRRDLEPPLRGAVISGFRLLARKIASHNEAFFKKQLLGRRLDGLGRRGKLLIFSLKDSPLTLLIHLKMTGQLILQTKKRALAGGHSLGGNDFASAVGGELPNQYTRAVISFRGGDKLYFNDLRKFGYLKLVTAAERAALLSQNYGPEPLTPAFTRAYLGRALERRKTSLKAALLNQKMVAGLGNIYVDEVLWRAKVSPARLAGSLSPAEINRLHQAINAVIGQAIAHRGTTFSDYVDSSGRQGNYSRRLKVYGRHGRPCPACREPLRRRKLAGRGTHFCAHCQK